MGKHKAIQYFSEFITEGTITQDGKFFDNVGSYVYTDFKKPGLSSRGKERLQKYRNNKTSVVLNMLDLIYKSGAAGVRYSDLSRLYFELGGDEEGKRDRYTGVNYSLLNRGWNATEDRGYGAAFLIGTNNEGQIGILHAHCTKNDKGRWVLTDPILIDLFSSRWAKEEGNWEHSDIDLLGDLGILGKVATQYKKDI